MTVLISNLARAENSGLPASPSGFSVGVEREISFINKGYVMINDTFLFSASNISGVSGLDYYLVGLPRNYGKNLIYYSAYDAWGDLSVTLVEGDDGFQWLKISFPEPIEINDGEEYNFTVFYVFSDLIKRKADVRGTFHADFPLYPSLRDDADRCNVTVFLPSNAMISYENYPNETFVNKTSDFTSFYNSTSPLPPYANVSSWMEFFSSSFQLFKISEMRRELSVEGLGKISVTDFYKLSMANTEEITFILPPNATDISVYDAYGIYPQDQIVAKEENYTATVTVTLSDKLKDAEIGRIAISYTLPSWRYLSRIGWQYYALKVNLIKPNEWVIRRIIVTVTLPEGASFIQEAQHMKIERLSFFQERASLNYSNVTKFQDLGVLNMEYQYMPLWIAFKPTLWAGMLTGLVSLALILIKSAGRAEAAAPIPVSPGTLRRFIEAYEERIHLRESIESLERLSRRGKISRRQYRLRRRNLDERLSIVQREIINLRRELEAAGARYAEMMRRLETASTDVESIKRDIAEVEVKYRRGEISAEVRRRLLREYQRRREDAESVIEEVLLRLREEL